ncbi:MAG: calcium/proton exchanger [Bacteroidetes bacterium]|nr:calcium/proton exchanger [Bacteroidota bacterium]
MTKKEKLILLMAIIVTAISGFFYYTHFNAVIAFIVTAAALALLAMIVGDATEQLGDRFSPAVTGIIQSALGNLPELFVCIFALRAGLDKMVQAALIGSVLGNSVLVLGVALFIGGLKNGKQVFRSGPPKNISIMMILAFGALAIPTFTSMFHTTAEIHLNTLDIFLAIILLAMFIGSLFFSLKSEAANESEKEEKNKGEKHAAWPLSITLVVLLLSGVAAAFVSDWFIDALQPAMKIVGINETFAGLVVVALAGNAIENVIGVQLAYKNKMDYSVSVIQNSSLQISLVLFPVLVLLSFVLGGAILSFVLTPMLLVCLGLGVLVSTFIVFDGESIWIEGLALIGLYLLIAAAFWWG